MTGTAVVVGSGPNGLAAAVTLAQHGLTVTVLEAADEIGGGTRSGEAIVAGLLHDHCSAIHPMAVGSAFLNDLGLDRHGLQWRWPEVDCVHPLDDGTAGVLYRSVQTTADGLGVDGRRWQQLFDWPSTNFDMLADDIMGPLLRWPHHPLALARFGAPTVLPGSALARVFRTPQARALFGGVAAHAFRPLHYPMTSAIRGGHPDGRTPVRLARRGRWLTVHHPGPGVSARRMGWRDRDGHPGAGRIATADRRGDDLRPDARRDRRHPR